jgi:hypothetical protein
MKKEGLEN